MAKAKAALGKTQAERDELKEDIAKIAEDLEKADSELAAAMQAQEQLQYRVTQLTQQRDVAIAEAKDAKAMVEGLTEQLKEKAEEIRELEEWTKQLQAAIQELQSQLEQIDEQMGEELYEEPGELSNEEIADGNNV